MDMTSSRYLRTEKTNDRRGNTQYHIFCKRLGIPAMVAHLLNKGKAREEGGGEQGDYRGRWRGDRQVDGEERRERKCWKVTSVLFIVIHPSHSRSIRRCYLITTPDPYNVALRCSSHINKTTWLPARSLSLSCGYASQTQIHKTLHEAKY